MSKKEKALDLVEYIATATGEQSMKRILFYTSELEKNTRITEEMLDKVLKGSYSRFEKFPTLIELVNYIIQETKISKNYQQDKKYLAEQRKLEQIIKKFLPVITQEGIDKYLIYWCKHMMGKDFASEIIKAGFTVKIFLKSAMFDLDEAEGNLQRAIEIGLRKQKIVSGTENKKQYPLLAEQT